MRLGSPSAQPGAALAVLAAMTHPLLLVDGDDEARDTLRDHLEADGYSVVAVDRCSAAAQLLATDACSKPCLLVIRFRDDIMTGWELMTIANTIARAAVPAIVISDKPPHLETFARGVVKAWLPLSCGVDELLRVVEQAADRHCDKRRESA
jgi:CheY-like chemotaxis protein